MVLVKAPAVIGVERIDAVDHVLISMKYRTLSGQH